jgi:hypothetical protein
MLFDEVNRLWSSLPCNFLRNPVSFAGSIFTSALCCLIRSIYVPIERETKFYTHM